MSKPPDRIQGGIDRSAVRVLFVLSHRERGRRATPVRQAGDIGSCPPVSPAAERLSSSKATTSSERMRAERHLSTRAWAGSGERGSDGLGSRLTCGRLGSRRVGVRCVHLVQPCRGRPVGAGAPERPAAARQERLRASRLARVPGRDGSVHEPASVGLDRGGARRVAVVRSARVTGRRGLGMGRARGRVVARARPPRAPPPRGHRR